MPVRFQGKSFISVYSLATSSILTDKYFVSSSSVKDTNTYFWFFAHVECD